MGNFERTHFSNDPICFLSLKGIVKLWHLWKFSFLSSDREFLNYWISLTLRYWLEYWTFFRHFGLLESRWSFVKLCILTEIVAGFILYSCWKYQKFYVTLLLLKVRNFIRQCVLLRNIRSFTESNILAESMTSFVTFGAPAEKVVVLLQFSFML